MNKITNKIALECAIAALGLSEHEYYYDVPVNDIIEKLNKMIEQIDKRAEANTFRKPTENQIENSKYMEEILNWLAAPNSGTATRIWRNVPSLKDNPDMTNQRVTALLTILIQENKVKKESIKGKTIFSLA